MNNNAVPVDWEAPLLVCRIAWMDGYCGVYAADAPVGGGAYVAEKGFGHEAYNFDVTDGVCLGYVQPNRGRIDISRLGAGKDATEITGVNVVWIAKHPEGGQRVVGWYFSATVYATLQYSSARNRLLPDGRQAGFYVTAEKGAILDISERTYEVPCGKGYIGQCNVWYPDADKAKEIIDYIRKVELKIAKMAGYDLP